MCRAVTKIQDGYGTKKIFQKTPEIFDWENNFIICHEHLML